MKKFASLKVFRNALFIFLVTCPAADFLCRDSSDLFQTPLKKCWEIKSGSINNIASDNEILILSDDNGDIAGIDKYSGTEEWKTSIGGKNESVMSLQNGDVILVSTENNIGSENNLFVRRLDSQTGIVEELIKIGRLDKAVSFESLKQLIIDHKYSGVDNLTKILEQAKYLSENTDKYSVIRIFPYNMKSFLISDGNVIEQIFFNNAGKKQLYRVKTDNQKISLIAVVDDLLIWGDESGNFFQKKSETDIPEKFLRTGGRASSIQISGDNLLITSSDNFLYFYSLTKKKVLWKKRLSGRIVISPKIGTASVVVTTNAVPELIFIDLENGKSFNQITLPEETFIKDFQINNDSVFILTNNNLSKFSEKCQ